MKKCFDQNTPFCFPPYMPSYPLSTASKPRTSPLSPQSSSMSLNCSLRVEKGFNVILVSALSHIGDWGPTRDNTGVIWKLSAVGGFSLPDAGNTFFIRYTPTVPATSISL